MSPPSHRHTVTPSHRHTVTPYHRCPQALHVAAENGFTAIALLLLDAGAKPNAAISGPRKWVTPIWLATQNDHPDTLRALLWHCPSAAGVSVCVRTSADAC